MLRLTRRSEYGLMAMALLARRAPTFACVREIGDQLNVPRRLLAEVLKDLARGGLVEGARGPGGGYRLMDTPAALSLGRILEVLEGPIHVVDCSDDGACEHESSCVIQTGMRFVSGRIQDLLNQSTLADLEAGLPAERTIPALTALQISV
jgi:Rrf2 family protein